MRSLGPSEDEVGGGEAGVEQALAHGLGGGGDGADGVRGVDLDELLEDVVRELAGGGIERLLGVQGGGKEGGEQELGGLHRTMLHGGDRKGVVWTEKVW